MGYPAPDIQRLQCSSSDTALYLQLCRQPWNWMHRGTTCGGAMCNLVYASAIIPVTSDRSTHTTIAAFCCSGLYPQKAKKLPPNWKYESSTASALVA